MKDYLKNGEGEQLNATASTVAEQIASMRNTVNGPHGPSRALSPYTVTTSSSCVA